MNSTRGWVLVIGILAIVGAGMFLISDNLRRVMQQTLQPVQDSAGAVSTRMFEVLNPTPTILPDPVTIIHDIRSLARLETVQYSIEKVITAEVGQGLFGVLFGDRLLFVAHGTVIAGVDLGKLTPEDLRVENNVLFVRLPPAEVFIATIDNEKSYVYDRETGLFTKGNINLETEARQAAERAIAESALEDGILETAKTNAQAFLSLLLRDLGYPAVIFEE